MQVNLKWQLCTLYLGVCVYEFMKQEHSRKDFLALYSSALDTLLKLRLLLYY